MQTVCLSRHIDGISRLPDTTFYNGLQLLLDDCMSQTVVTTSYHGMQSVYKHRCLQETTVDETLPFTHTPLTNIHCTLHNCHFHKMWTKPKLTEPARRARMLQNLVYYDGLRPFGPVIYPIMDLNVTTRCGVSKKISNQTYTFYYLVSYLHFRFLYFNVYVNFVKHVSTLTTTDLEVRTFIILEVYSTVEAIFP